MSFKGLRFSQVKKLKDDNALRVYRKLQKGELNWTPVMGDKSTNSILTVCEQHEGSIQEFLKRTAMLTRCKTLRTVFPDHVPSN